MPPYDHKLDHVTPLSKLKLPAQAKKVSQTLARQLKRPVRWREDRMENLVASAHARETLVTTRAAVSAGHAETSASAA